MARTLNRDEERELETLVDRTSVAAVLEALGNICDEKANHLREAWNEPDAAKTWEKDGARIQVLARKVYT